MRMTKTIWIRGGAEPRAIAGMGLGRIYDLFLGDGREREEAARELLHMVLDRASPLLARFGAGSDVLPAGRKAAVDACTILSTCLYKLGERKERIWKTVRFCWADSCRSRICCIYSIAK